ncbi:MAG: vWA domain-containing protein [Deltaproteobacteria bacterium]
MIDRQRIATFGIATTAVATVALALWLKPWASGSLTGPKPDPVADSHRIDVVFAVDTTGSMGGLLDGAKRTVWSIASHIREVDKNADVHVGLVAYKDLGDVYVTKDFPLTSDVDAVFAELSTYTAEGGGDVPEDVDAALDDAVHKMAWREGAKKMIFLVGDAPPASRGEVPRFDVSARDAAGKGIMINTIRCGTASDTAEAWQQIASIGTGEFSSIQQNGGVQQIATPYDQKMAELSHTIDSTAVIYGDAATRGAYEGKMAVQAAAPAAVAADRADYYAKAPAKKGGGRAKEDVVGGVATGTVAVESLDKDMLPADMRNKSTDEIKAEITERAAKRDAAQAELAKVSKERAEYLKAHEKEAGEGFDVKVKQTVDRELAK